MTKSESIANLAAALSKAQAEFKAVAFDATNPFLKNKFASLGAIIAATQPIIARHGLAAVQLPVNEGNLIGIETVLIHSSGEWLAARVVLPLPEEKGKSLAQVAGSTLTYLRRYALASALRLYADDDTDGHGEVHPAPAREKTFEEIVDGDAPPVRPLPAAPKVRQPSGDVTTTDALLKAVKEIRSKPGADKEWVGWIVKLVDGNDQEFEVGTFKEALKDKLDVLAGQVCSVAYKPGRKAGTFELVDISPVADVPS